MKDITNNIFELDIVLIGFGGALMAAGIQHEIAWLGVFGAILMLGNVVKLIAKYS